MMYSNWMGDGFGRGHGMWQGGFNGGFDSFGPASILTISLFTIFVLVSLIWTIGIKGYSLWTAAKRNEKWWFIALLVINTFGLLELVYLIFFAKVWPKKSDKKEMKDGHEKNIAEEKSN